MNTNSHNPNFTRPSDSTGRFSVCTDVTQWRQDVDAFSAATRQMLESIHQELSIGLSQGQAKANLVTKKPTEPSSPKQPTSGPTITQQVAESRPCTKIVADEVAIESEQILARLKAQLAEQLNQ